MGRGYCNPCLYSTDPRKVSAQQEDLHSGLASRLGVRAASSQCQAPAWLLIPVRGAPAYVPSSAVAC